MHYCCQSLVARSTTLVIYPIAVMYMLVTGGVGLANQVAPTTVTAAVTASLLRLLFARYANDVSLCIAWLFCMDHRYHDQKAWYTIENRGLID